MKNRAVTISVFLICAFLTTSIALYVALQRRDAALQATRDQLTEAKPWASRAWHICTSVKDGIDWDIHQLESAIPENRNLAFDNFLSWRIPDAALLVELCGGKLPPSGASDACRAERDGFTPRHDAPVGGCMAKIARDVSASLPDVPPGIRK